MNPYTIKDLTTALSPRETKGCSLPSWFLFLWLASMFLLSFPTMAMKINTWTWHRFTQHLSDGSQHDERLVFKNAVFSEHKASKMAPGIKEVLSMQHRQSFLFRICFRVSSKQTREGLGVESGSLPAGQFSITDLHCNSENRPQQAKGSKVQYLAGINKAVGGSHFWKRLSYLRSQFLRAPKRHDGYWHFVSSANRALRPSWCLWC